MTSNIFLIGGMGSGKTTIGRRLAHRLGKHFYDSDHEIERLTGVTIPWIFDVEGEAGFRKRERQVIHTLTQEHHIILATGGGAILDERNRQDLSNRGLVIYLKTHIHHQLQRLNADKTRPLLQTPDREALLTEIMNIREPLYQETADYVIETGAHSLNQVIQEIIERYLAHF